MLDTSKYFEIGGSDVTSDADTTELDKDIKEIQGDLRDLKKEAKRSDLDYEEEIELTKDRLKSARKDKKIKLFMFDHPDFSYEEADRMLRELEIIE